MLNRRTLLLVSGAALPALVGGAARALPAYPQLADPAIKVRSPMGVYMVAAATSGSRIFAGGEQGVILYSDNQGANWQQAAVPFSGTVTSIGFATPQVGWATGAFGVILNTTDGGKTWVKQLDGLREIDLMNAATQAYVASQPPGSDTADHATRRAQILAEQGPDKPFLSILPISATEAFAFGSYRFAEHTTDGGKSWTDWSMRIDDPLSHNIYDAAAIGGALYLVSETGLVFQSTDGGQSFKKLAQPGDATLFGICDAGPGGILVYGVAGGLYASPDQGKTWNQVNIGDTANINTVVRMPGGPLLLGDAGGSIWVSRDNGATFKLGIRNPLLMINALLPLDAHRFLIMSDIGVLPADLATLNV